MLGAVLRNELLKTLHRLAFWVGFIFFVGINTLEFANRYIRARYDPDRTFGLPGAWSDILTDDVEAVFIFGAVMLILLIGNEFTWRTARQNVIDGLSKEQWFVGKLFLLPLLLVLFYGGRVVPGAAFGYLGREGGEPLITGTEWAAMGGGALGIVGAMSLAFFIVMAVRSAGAAMGVWLLWFAAIENLIASGLTRISESFEPVVRFFPSSVFPALFRWVQYDPAAFERAVERAAENDRPPPEIWDLGTLVGAAGIWTVVLLGASFLWYRRRDL